MSVKIYRPGGRVDYSNLPIKVRIEFLDGTHMVGTINIHSKYIGQEGEADDFEGFVSTSSPKYKFRRTSDYLRDCNQNESMLTVYNASYGGWDNKTCFVFLHSVKFISEEKMPEKKVEETDQYPENESSQERRSFSLREKLKDFND
ncbi:hypothetical protein [Desulfobacca acetoxidans]